jgi:uncharacterized membrane protein YfcA
MGYKYALSFMYVAFGVFVLPFLLMFFGPYFIASALLVLLVNFLSSAFKRHEVKNVHHYHLKRERRKLVFYQKQYG